MRSILSKNCQNPSYPCDFMVDWDFYVVFDVLTVWSYETKNLNANCLFWKSYEFFYRHRQMRLEKWPPRFQISIPGSRPYPVVRPDGRRRRACRQRRRKKNIWSRRPRLAASIKCDKRPFPAKTENFSKDFPPYHFCKKGGVPVVRNSITELTGHQLLIPT